MMRAPEMGDLTGKTIDSYTVDRVSQRITFEFTDGTAIELDMESRARGSVWIDVFQRAAGEARRKPWKPWVPPHIPQLDPPPRPNP